MISTTALLIYLQAQGDNAYVTELIVCRNEVKNVKYLPSLKVAGSDK